MLRLQCQCNLIVMGWNCPCVIDIQMLREKGAMLSVVLPSALFRVVIATACSLINNVSRHSNSMFTYKQYESCTGVSNIL